MRPPHDHTIPAEFADEHCLRCRWDDHAWNIGALAFMVFCFAIWALS